MKIEAVGIDEFLTYPIKVTNYLSESLTIELQSNSQIKKSTIETIDDCGILEPCKLAWYKNSENQPVSWESIDKKHIRITEINTINSLNKSKINDIKLSLTQSLYQDINIILISSPNREDKIIIDGIHRAISLYDFFINDKKLMESLLISKFKISLINFSSTYTPLVFPFDFPQD